MTNPFSSPSSNLLVWMRWRVDGGGAGSHVVAMGNELVAGPENGGSLVVTRPVGGGPMRLWDLERDAPVGAEDDLIVPLGSGVVARYARYDPDAESGEPRLERLSTGEEIALRIPGLPDSFNVVPGAWGGTAFAWWRNGVVAFDPSTGEPLGPVMTLPDVRVRWGLCERDTRLGARGDHMVGRARRHPPRPVSSTSRAESSSLAGFATSTPATRSMAIS